MLVSVRTANADPHPRGTQPGCGMKRRGRGSALGDLSARRPFEGRRRKGVYGGESAPSPGRVAARFLEPPLDVRLRRVAIVHSARARPYLCIFNVYKTGLDARSVYNGGPDSAGHPQAGGDFRCQSI